MTIAQAFLFAKTHKAEHAEKHSLTSAELAN